MASIKTFAQGLRSKWQQWRARRAQKAAVAKHAANVAASMARAQAVQASRGGSGKSARMYLMSAARSAFLADDRVTMMPGDVHWWPALAPLTRAERDVVRQSLNLPVRPISREVEETREAVGLELDRQVAERMRVHGK